MNGGRLVRFVYGGDEWRDQFIRRPGGIMRVREAAPARIAAGADAGLDGTGRWRALVERTPQFDRVLSLSPTAGDTAWLEAIAALAARASAAKRRLFCFTSEQQASQLRDRGFEIVDGYLTALIANEAILRAACTAGRGAPGSSDALPSQMLMSEALTSQALADTASPWCLGGWSVRNGDRM